MESISADGPDRLVFQVRSPLHKAVGGLGLFFMVWLGYHWLSHHPNHERTLGLIGATITCLPFILFAETSDFVFDAARRRLTWSRRVGFVCRSGVVPFEAIRLVAVRTALGSDAIAPSQRIVLLTHNGELPLSASYSPSDAHAGNAERLRIFLGQAPVEPLSATIDALVAAGRDMDAIRELRLARGMSLTDAHAEVARLRTKGSKIE